LQLLDDSKASLMQATPSTLRMLIEAGWQTSRLSGLNGLKVLCGGEALSWKLAMELQQRAESVWNMYGPTETTIWSSVWKVEREAGRVSIGRAIANTQFYILDCNLQPVPIGVAGEIYIGGEGMARGYHNRVELTRERFIPDPFSSQAGAS